MRGNCSPRLSLVLCMLSRFASCSIRRLAKALTRHVIINAKPAAEVESPAVPPLKLCLSPVRAALFVDIESQGVNIRDRYYR